MHEKALPTGSRRLLSSLNKDAAPALQGWILAGGTGLALHLGHRKSEDFDFFRIDGMDGEALHDALSRFSAYETLQQTGRSLSVLVQGVKLSFFQVKDRFMFPGHPYLFFHVADVRDIALMKLLAITNRGSRKDFVDLFTILRDGPSLDDYLGLMREKYGQSRINVYQILTSLTYFEDAEQEPLPEMLEPFDWEECRDFFIRESRRIILPY